MSEKRLPRTADLDMEYPEDAVVRYEDMDPIEQAFGEAMHEDCPKSPPNHSLSEHSPWSGGDLQGTEPWHVFLAKLRRHGLSLAATPPQPSAGLQALPESWEAAANRTAERALLGDPAAAMATSATLRSCANDLRAALSAAKPDAPEGAVGKPILSFTGTNTEAIPGPLGHSHLWFCQCSDPSIPKHLCGAAKPDAGREALDVERLARALRSVDGRIVALYPEHATELLENDEPGRHEYAASIAAAYADAAGEAVSDADAYQWETKAWSVSGFTHYDPRLDAIRERARRADGLLPQAVADRAYLLGLVNGIITDETEKEPE